MMTITGYQKRIMQAAPHVSKSKAEKLAHKIAKRFDRMTTEHEFFEQLRILGVISDPTARDAIKNLEAAA